MERLRPWLRRSGWAYILLAVALGALAWRITTRTPAPTQPSTSVSTARVVASGGGDRGDGGGKLVHVAGAVRKPGLYRVAPDGRVAQAIRSAGGATAAANLDGVNLAAPVNDGDKVLVPESVAAAGPGASASATTGPISLASATVEQLEPLDGIGPTLAARIVAWRAEHGGFASVDQLLDVPGIGQARLDGLRDKVAP